eukprot:4801073-Heterocapsa_arctica.AAC.1
MARVSTLLAAAKLDPRWSIDVWLGKTSDSDEHIVPTAEKIAFARSVKKLPSTEVPKNLYKDVMKWTPWM